MPQAFLCLSQTVPTWQLYFSFHRPDAAQAAIQGKREAGAEEPLVLTERLYEDEPVPAEMCHTSVALPLRPSKPGAESHLESNVLPGKAMGEVGWGPPQFCWQIVGR